MFLSWLLIARPKIMPRALIRMPTSSSRLPGMPMNDTADRSGSLRFASHHRDWSWSVTHQAGPGSARQAAPQQGPTSPPAPAGRHPTSIASFSQASSGSSPFGPPEQGGASSVNALVYVVSGRYAHPIRHARPTGQEDPNALFDRQVRKGSAIRRADNDVA